jgi:2-desacetyl-2-hydroxyethyl bacteriochlorophyllide A dehydrogenase
MKQAVMTAPGQIEIRKVIKPVPGPDEVLLRIRRIGVCGSDIHVYHGKHPYTDYPVIQGHEFSATLVAVGDEVKDLQPRLKVTSLPQIYCGECAPCKRGDYNICNNLKVQGFQTSGCAQEFYVTKAEKIVPLPESFSYEMGALVEPLSVAVHAVHRVGSLQDHHVVVLGAGPIGNMVAQVACSEGAYVLITDISEYRLNIAQKCGLEMISNANSENLRDASNRFFKREDFDIAFECVGVEATISEVIPTIQKGGDIIIVGVFSEKPKIDLGLVQDRELNIHGTLMYKKEDYLKAVELIYTGKVLTEPLISKHFSLDNYLKAYQYIDDLGDKSMKVIIDVA